MPITQPREYVIIDVETTGFKPEEGHEIIEIGAQKITGSLLADQFHSLVIPTRLINTDSQRVHGITMEMVRAEGRPIAEVMPEFLSFIGKAVLIGHNIGFDLGFINAHLKRLNLQALLNDTLDTCQLAKRYLLIPSYSLQNVARYLKVEPTEKHRAMADVETTRQVFMKLIERALQVKQ